MDVTAFIEVIEAAHELQLRVEQIPDQLQLLGGLMLAFGKAQLEEAANRGGQQR
jgi:hypothetical protein